MIVETFNDYNQVVFEKSFLHFKTLHFYINHHKNIPKIIYCKKIINKMIKKRTHPNNAFQLDQ